MSTFFVLRNHKGRPGVGRFLAHNLDAVEITAGHRPLQKPKAGDVILNYGVSRAIKWPVVDGVTVINRPESVDFAVNKLNTLRVLTENNIPCLEYTTDPAVVLAWLHEGFKVYARTLLRSKQGNGIVLVKPHEAPPNLRANLREDDIIDAPLYTKHFKNIWEYRVHTAPELILDFTQKRRMGEVKLRKKRIAEVNNAIRNKKRGWVMAHEGIELPPAQVWNNLKEDCMKAVRELRLEYAGVDVLYNRYKQEYRICEINSAPGMFKKRTQQAYLDYFRSFQRPV